MAVERRANEAAARKTRADFGLSGQELQSILDRVSPEEFKAAYKKIRHAEEVDGWTWE
jgi:hypothetical protein